MTPQVGLGNAQLPATPPLVMSPDPVGASPRIHLSVPHMGGAEERYVREAIATNWLSTVGPNIDAFEAEFSRRIGLPAVAVSSGTAALHLGLRLLGVGPGDEVFSPTLTFVASVNPIAYLGGTPVFLDSERASWNIDPNVLEHALAARARAGRLPKALVVVHLFGQSADMDPIVALCERHGVLLLEDAAEALGALYRGRPAGTIAPVGRLLVQRQQDHHHDRRRHAGRARCGAGAESAVLVHPGARSWPGLSTHRDGLQLPHE